MSMTPFIIERVYNASVEKVWKAITDKDQMKQWYFDLPGFKPEVGVAFSFVAPNESGDIRYEHKCVVTSVVTGKKIAYSWRYEGYTGNSVVTFELFPEGDGTRLKLTHEGLETFPANNPDFAKKNFENGWTYITGASLKAFVEKI